MKTNRVKTINIDIGARLALEVLSDLWSPLVIHALDKQTLRTGDLKNAIQGVSQKMLTQTLRKLEHYGIVKRRVFPEVPPRVEYSLTEMGHSLREPLRTLCHWGEAHRTILQEARKRRADRVLG